MNQINQQVVSSREILLVKWDKSNGTTFRLLLVAGECEFAANNSEKQELFDQTQELGTTVCWSQQECIYKSSCDYCNVLSIRVHWACSGGARNTGEIQQVAMEPVFYKLFCFSLSTFSTATTIKFKSSCRSFSSWLWSFYSSLAQVHIFLSTLLTF